MTYIVDIPLKIDCEKWYNVAEAIPNWPNNERTRHFHSRYVPDELREILAAQFKIPFDIATFHKHFPMEGYMWHKDIDRQTVVICQISPDNPNIYLEVAENDDMNTIKRYDYTRGNAVLLNGQILHRVVNIEPEKNRYIVTMGWHKKYEDLEYHSFQRLKDCFEKGEFMHV